jgi:hypothetical protein
MRLFFFEVRLLARLRGFEKGAQLLDVFGKNAREADTVANLRIAGDDGCEQDERVVELKLQVQIRANRKRENALDVAAGEAEIGGGTAERRSASFRVNLDRHLDFGAWRVASLFVRCHENMARGGIGLRRESIAHKVA